MKQGRWDPDQYARFAEERAQPFRDLARLVVSDGVERAVDLGCGSGELTAELAERLDAGEVLGLDSSPAMLQRAEQHRGARLRFDHADIGS